MQDIFESYSKLKSFLISSSMGPVKINELVELYSSSINSVRQKSRIHDITSLITVLEKRDILNPENVSTLSIIFDALALNPEILVRHEILISNQEPNNCKPTHQEKLYRENKHPSPNQTVNYKSQTCNAVSASNIQQSRTPSIQRKLSGEVVKAIASQIGYSWKPLARYLDIIEGIIESIDENPNNTTNEMKARLMLAEYEEQVDSSEMNLKLLKALDMSGRKDLHDQVLDIFL